MDECIFFFCLCFCGWLEVSQYMYLSEIVTFLLLSLWLCMFIYITLALSIIFRINLYVSQKIYSHHKKSFGKIHFFRILPLLDIEIRGRFRALSLLKEGPISRVAPGETLPICPYFQDMYPHSRIFR